MIGNGSPPIFLAPAEAVVKEEKCDPKKRNVSFNLAVQESDVFQLFSEKLILSRVKNFERALISLVSRDVVSGHALLLTADSSPL